MKQWLIPTLTFMKYLMKNHFLIQALREIEEDQAHQRTELLLNPLALAKLSNKKHLTQPLN
jgi:hypothetical protein